MQKAKDILLLLLPVLVVFLLWHKGAADPGKVTRHTTTHVIYLKDTSTHMLQQTLLQPVNHFYYNTETHIDTGSIIRDYFTKNTVIDSTGDSLVRIQIRDTVHKNMIASRLVSWKFLKPYQVDRNTITRIDSTIERNPAGFYGGPFAYYAPASGRIGAGLELDLVTRRAVFGAGYDLLNRNLQGKILIKIGK